MAVVHNTAIVKLWVPVVVLAHVFSLFFFAKLILVSNPRLFKVFRRRRSSNEKLPKARNSEDDEGKEGAEDIVLTLDKQRQVVSIREKTIGEFFILYESQCALPVLAIAPGGHYPPTSHPATLPGLPLLSCC
jgi:hypothetical protein